MKAKTFCSLAVLIILLNSLSYSQTLDSPKIKGKNCYDLMKEQSGNDKSNLILSLSGGYAGLFKESKRPNGFNLQADVLYPIAENFGLNLAVNFSQFPGYSYEFHNTLHDTFYVKGTDNIGNFTQINFMPGMSFGNYNSKSKFNYYITAGTSLGICRHAVTSRNVTSNYPGFVSIPPQNSPQYYFDFGVYASGRISYKATDRFRIFLEPTAFSNFKESAESNYRINGGVSIAL